MRLNPQIPVPSEIGARRSFRFSLALPLGQLLLCAILLCPIRMWIFVELGVPERLLGFVTLPHEHMHGGGLRYWSSISGLEIAAMLNLPAGMVQLPYDIYSPSHNDFHPPGVDLKVWRAVTWPILGTFFWWVAGRGADALAASRRRTLTPKIKWAEAILGLVLSVLSITGTIGVVFFSGADRHDPLLPLFAFAGVMWTILGALPFIARIVQWRLCRNPAVSS